MLVGIHGRNDRNFTEADFTAIEEAQIEAVKLLSFTQDATVVRLLEINPDVVLTVRLFSEGFGVGSHPSPRDFVQSVRFEVERLAAFTDRFEIHNEPNHPAGYEGWDPSDESARAFNEWFLQVYERLKELYPHLELGFPGLAVPHRDLEWLEVCRPAVERADFLGGHCYWQTLSDQPDNHLADTWGLRFKLYHAKFPDKVLEITEFGNSNGQANPPLALPEEERIRQYVEYYQTLYEHSYVFAAHAFILSSPDPGWERQGFVWVKQNGEIRPVVSAVGGMPRRRGEHR